MKQLHIIALLAIAVTIGILVSVMGNFSRYETFNSPYAVQGKEINVVGHLVADKEMTYNPHEDANLFTFFMEDEEGTEMKVIYRDSKPRDIERAENIVVSGRVKDDVFHASNILMKCPSKYVEEELKTAAN